MKQPPTDQPSPIGLAMEWVSRILAVSLEMILPGLAGKWLDSKLGTGFLVLLGFGLGITLAIWHLLVMTKASGAGGKSKRNDDQVGSDADRP